LNLTKSTELYVILLKRLAEKTLNDDDRSVDIERLNSIANGLQRVATNVHESINMLFEPYKKFDLDNLFISAPYRIVKTIKELRTYPEIMISDESPESLELLFPGNILFGILSELVENAGKPVQDDRKVLIQWQTNGGKFQCEVHDNGLGIIPAIGDRFVPLDLLPAEVFTKKEGSGLGIIDRIITRAKGLFLVSNSKVLGGSLVLIELPVIAFKK
jgi:K+-sensing histidine kinase KdpD